MPPQANRNSMDIKLQRQNNFEGKLYLLIKEKSTLLRKKKSNNLSNKITSKFVRINISLDNLFLFCPTSTNLIEMSTTVHVHMLHRSDNDHIPGSLLSKQMKC